jgi:LacI family sucrose operon transcriptional repressor
MGNYWDVNWGQGVRFQSDLGSSERNPMECLGQAIVGVLVSSNVPPQGNAMKKKYVRKKAKPRVTMQAIAERAGVSRSTVSFVMNGRDQEFKIATDTRERVLEAIREFNYQPDAVARVLQGQKTKTIGVLWSLSGYNPIIEMVNRIALMAKRHGYASFLNDHLNDSKETLAALEEFVSRRVDAIVIDADRHILSDTAVLDALNNFEAVVAVSNEFMDIPFDLVVHRRDPLYEQATRHMVSTGRKQFLIVMPDVAIHDLKVEATRKVLEEAGFEPSALIEIRYHVDYPVVQPTLVQNRLVDTLDTRFPQEVPFDALLCVSDEDAACCMEWLKGRGRRVPEDVAVAGANDTLLGRMLDPPLASGLRHNEEVAEVIEQFLFRRLEDPSIAPQQATVEMEFLCRASAGAAR